MRLITSYPLSLALTRLKANLFLLLLTLFITNLFTPYLTIRRGLIQLFKPEYAGRAIWWFQTLILSVEVLNIVEAGISIFYPQPVQPVIQHGNKMTPIRMSSPITRAYKSPQQPPQSPSPLQRPTPSQTLQQISTPIKSPNRSAPLSASTAKILNLPQVGTPSKTGLFNESPSKPQGEVQRNEVVDGYVMVNRDNQEMVDNLYKGVRGKGGRVVL